MANIQHRVVSGAGHAGAEENPELSWQLIAEFASLWPVHKQPPHPIQHLRRHLADRGTLTTAQVTGTADGTRIQVGGAITHRPRPTTASGITFPNLEDDTGMLNIVCDTGIGNRSGHITRTSPALLLHGIVQATPDGVASLRADHAEPLHLGTGHNSHDFR
jgi:error-prone DNA polymerase